VQRDHRRVLNELLALLEKLAANTIDRQLAKSDGSARLGVRTRVRSAAAAAAAQLSGGWRRHARWPALVRSGNEGVEAGFGWGWIGELKASGHVDLDFAVGRHARGEQAPVSASSS
jgi:hypothetical protein